MSEIGLSYPYYDIATLPTILQMHDLTGPTLAADLISGSKTDTILGLPVNRLNGTLSEICKDWFTNRLIFLPPEYDFSIIATYEEIPGLFWNTLPLSITLSDVDIDDTSIDIDITPPVTILSWKSLSFIISASGLGNPTVDTDAVFTFIGYERTLSVTGFRAIALELLHNWDTNYVVNYEFNTVVTQNKKFYEQRRQQYTNMRKTIDINSLMFTQDKIAKIKNMMQLGVGRMFIVAIESEPISLDMTGSIQALTSLSTIETLSGYFNLWNLSDYAIAVDFVNYNFEVLNIDSIAANTITLSTEIMADMDAANVVVYPAMIAYIESFKINQITSVISGISVRAKELVYYG